MWYDFLINQLEEQIIRYNKSGNIDTFDSELIRLMPKYKFFQTKKRLVYHRDGYSPRT